ncbi:hypothetical protein FBUS_05026 [Fasciolopsis buskii]|uniref:G-protein coupled receptors family 1 profile domain-containing protein n=1 Tax=Fasciolopsis buskii TaxID=27845 RepID=A0A8E0RT79_9TREM|nr:hypothetical protein FBUS_05026 [Fasciolopsis buski]
MQSELYDKDGSGHELRTNLTASVQFVLLVFVLFLSLVENLFLFLVSFASVHRWCRDRYVKHRYRDGFNSQSGYFIRSSIRKGLQTERPLSSRLRNESEDCESNDLFGNAYQICPTPQYDRYSDAEMDRISVGTNYPSDHIGNITRLYFGNLCLANLLLALLAMPFSIAASIGTTNGPGTISTQTNFTFHIEKAEHHDNILLKYPLIISGGMCAFIESIVCAIMMATVYSLVHLTADRLLAISLPLHYHRLATRNRVLISICLVWIVSALFVSLAHLLALIPGMTSSHSMTMHADSDKDIYRCFILGQHDEEKHWRMAITYFFLVFIFPFAFIIAAYVRIYIIVRRCLLGQLSQGTHMPRQETGTHQRLRRSFSSGQIQQGTSNANIEANSQTVVSAQAVLMGRSCIAEQLSKAGSHRSHEPWISYRNNNRGQKVQTKAAKTACLLVITFFSLTAPYFIFCAVEPFLNIHFSVIPEETQDELFETISSIIVWLLYVNSVLTPGLYALRDGVLRRRIASIWPVPYKNTATLRPRSFVD